MRRDAQQPSLLTIDSSGTCSIVDVELGLGNRRGSTREPHRLKCSPRQVRGALLATDILPNRGIGNAGLPTDRSPHVAGREA